MKIGVLNDSHGKGKNPCHRLGDMHQDMMVKLDESISLFKDCNFVIHLGDIWDSPYISNSIIDDWVDRIEGSKQTWYVLPGNHDMIGASWNNSQSSALAHAMRRSNRIKLLTEKEEHIEGEINSVYIKGYPYHFQIEEELKNNGLKTKNKSDFKIACTHAFITEKPFHSQVLHVLGEDIKSNYNLILCSHFHSVFDFTVKNTRFLNLGAWGRLSITEAKHEPRVAIIDTDTKEVEIIKLKSAKKGSEIFDLSKVEEVKEMDSNMEAFIKSLESVNFQATDIRERLVHAGKELNVGKEIISYLTDKIDNLEIE